MQLWWADGRSLDGTVRYVPGSRSWRFAQISRYVHKLQTAAEMLLCSQIYPRRRLFPGKTNLGLTFETTKLLVKCFLPNDKMPLYRRFTALLLIGLVSPFLKGVEAAWGVKVEFENYCRRTIDVNVDSEENSGTLTIGYGETGVFTICESWCTGFLGSSRRHDFSYSAYTTSSEYDCSWPREVRWFILRSMIIGYRLFKHNMRLLYFSTTRFRSRVLMSEVRPIFLPSQCWWHQIWSLEVAIIHFHVCTSF